MEHWKRQWMRLLPKNVAEVLERLDDDAPLLEIRLRCDAPLELVFDGADRIVFGNNGTPMISAEALRDLTGRLMEYSAYAWENERRDGFITVGADTLSDEQVAQILDIVLRETGKSAENVKISTTL